jgi:hypothetical protein
MGYFSEHSAIGTKRNYKVSDITPISDGLDTFQQGFGVIGDMWSGLKDYASNIPIIGSFVHALFDSPVVGIFQTALDGASALTSGLATAFRVIEPLLQPVYKSWLQSMGQWRATEHGGENMAGINEFLDTPGALQRARGGIDSSLLGSSPDEPSYDGGASSFQAFGLINSPNTPGAFPVSISVR